MSLIEALDDYLDDAMDSDLQKAGRILKTANHQLALTASGNKYKVSVPSESGNKPYSVTIKPDNGFLDVTCSCLAYDKYGDCKHAVAAGIYLKNNFEKIMEANGVQILNGKRQTDDDYFDDEFEENDEWIENVESIVETIPSDSSGRRGDGSFLIEMESINITMLMRLADNVKDKELKSLANKTGAPFIEERTFRFPIVEKKNSVFEVRVYFDGRTKFETSCTCGRTDEKLCLHTAAIFYYLNWSYGSRYFDKFKTFEEEKNEILKSYGLSFGDPEAAEFKWSTDFYGRLTLVSKPAYMVSTALGKRKKYLPTK